MAEVLQVVPALDVALVAAADELAYSHSHRGGPEVELEPVAAALADERDLAALVEERYHEGAELGLAAGDAHAVGADESGVAVRRLQYLPDHLLALLAGLAEAAGDDHRALDTLGLQILEDPRHEAGRHDDQGHVHVAGDVPDAGVALEPLDLLGLGVDGVDVALEAALLYGVQQHVTPLEGVRAGADNRDALGHEYLV